MVWYAGLIVLIGLERVAELVVSKRNAAWALSRGGVESGRGHYPFMVALHTGLLAGCLLEVRIADRPFVPALGWTMLALVVGAQGLRWWCIGSLGRQWNTRVIVVPGLALVDGAGPYRWRSSPMAARPRLGVALRHPNYLAVVVEGAALPLVHSAWITAIAFTVANALLLSVRIQCEERALAEASTTGTGNTA